MYVCLVVILFTSFRTKTAEQFLMNSGIEKNETLMKHRLLFVAKMKLNTIKIKLNAC
jgi:hypothetical protein